MGAYDLGFARWVYANIQGGDRLPLCMQCGACSGSCPIGVQMDHGPRKLFMMIRAGMKEDVLRSNTLWNCTSCYRCVVRCPRGVPVTTILQDLAAKSAALGLSAAGRANVSFSRSFWWSASTFGRTDERLITARYYFSFGLKEGIRRARANLSIALGMIQAGRMHIGWPHRIRGRAGLKRILAKAKELEWADRAQAGMPETQGRSKP
jgi:quinone-modifying oxidoreductase subunit QmoC